MGAVEVKPYPWSYSHIKQFEQCPRQYHHVKVLKEYPFEETPEIRYGNDLHKAAEKYIRDGTPLPDRFSFMQKALDYLASYEGEKLCESKMGLTKNLEPCGFFDNGVWFRGVSDLSIIASDTARVVDYKGGSAKYADTGQLELMTMATFIHHPEVQTVKAALFFVVEKKLITETYERDQHELGLWRKWLMKYNRFKKAHENDVWNPNPSGLCKKHCPVEECEHNGRSTV